MKEDIERYKRMVEDRDTEIAILTEKVKILTLENIRLMNKESRKHLLRPNPPKYNPLTQPHPKGEEVEEYEDA